jgi:GT2 family glycosyltransferase
VIVVDNNSADGMIDEFKSVYPAFLFINNHVNGGFADGCNHGSNFAKGDFFLFLNADTVAPEETVEKLLERTKANPGNFISSCRQIDEKNRISKAYGLFPAFGTLTGFERTILKLFNRKKFPENMGTINNTIYPDWVSGSVMIIKKEIFRDLGGFDNDFWMYYEDTDICQRARDKKGNIAYYNDIEIQHNHGGSSRINFRTTSITKTEVIISKHVYISKHMTGTNRVFIQSYLVLINLIGGALIAIPGLLLFAVPEIFIRVHIYWRLISYYFVALKRRSWISPRSVNFDKIV